MKPFQVVPRNKIRTKKSYIIQLFGHTKFYIETFREVKSVVDNNGSVKITFTDGTEATYTEAEKVLDILDAK